jgi:hypothetical protein
MKTISQYQTRESLTDAIQVSDRKLFENEEYSVPNASKKNEFWRRFLSENGIFYKAVL